MPVSPKKIYVPINLQSLGLSNVGSINKVVITAPATAATLTLADGSSLITSGANSLTLTSAGTTNATYPTGTITLADLTTSQPLTNKKLNTSNCSFADNSDQSKLLKFSVSGSGTGRAGTISWAVTSSDKTITLPNITSTVAVLGLAQTFSTLQTFNAGITSAGAGLSTTTGGLSLGAYTDSTTTGSSAIVSQSGTTDYSKRIFTNGSLTSIAGVTLNSASELSWLNDSGGPITIQNNATVGGSDTNIITGYGADIIVPNGATIYLTFDLNSNNLKVVNSYNIPVLGDVSLTNGSNFGTTGTNEAYIGATGSGGFAPLITLTSNNAGTAVMKIQSSGGNVYIDGTPIGLSTPDQGFFTTLQTSGDYTMGDDSVILTQKSKIIATGDTTGFVSGNYHLIKGAASGSGPDLYPDPTLALLNTAKTDGQLYWFINDTSGTPGLSFVEIPGFYERMKFFDANGGYQLYGDGTFTGAINMTSTTKAFSPPRVSTTQKNTISSPTGGMMVYDTTLNKLCVYGASAWETVTSI